MEFVPFDILELYGNADRIFFYNFIYFLIALKSVENWHPQSRNNITGSMMRECK